MQPAAAVCNICIYSYGEMTRTAISTTISIPALKKDYLNGLSKGLNIMSTCAAIRCLLLACIIYATHGYAIVVPPTSKVNSGNSNLTNAMENRPNFNLQEGNTTISWLRKWLQLRQQMEQCVKQTNHSNWSCFKRSSLSIFDETLQAPVIPLWEGIRLVRLHSEATYDMSNDLTDSYQRQDLQHLTWFDRMAMRLASTFSTHMLQVNLKQLTDAYMSVLEKAENSKLKSFEGQSNNTTVGTARHRRHRYNMMMTMMFGATALGAVLVPMGFQLLSIVSGKALLLAKMALLLASINGLKKVATSGIHYGLYHVPGEQYGGGYYDRGDAHHPRNVASFTIAQPLELGIQK